MEYEKRQKEVTKYMKSLKGKKINYLLSELKELKNDYLEEVSDLQQEVKDEEEEVRDIQKRLNLKRKHCDKQEQQLEQANNVIRSYRKIVVDLATQRDYEEDEDDE